MKLFLKILLGFILLIALAIGILWFAAKQSNKPGPPADPLTSLDDAGLKAAIDGIAAERKLVGMAAKVMVGGDVIAQAVTGWRTKDEQTALQLDDLYHMGSIGKSMSATAIARLVEAGAMSWDDTLGSRLSDMERDPAWADVTLSQLLTHTASIPRAPISGMINQVSEPVRLAEVRREMAATLLSEPPRVAPGSAFAYSNEGFMLASLMAEEATGEHWETIIRTQLATPLSMDRLGFGAPTGEDTAEVPWGHRKLGPAKIAADPSEAADNPPWMAAAGTMHMGLDDLLSYAQAHLDAGQSSQAILSPATFERLHTPDMNDYAYGWVVQSRDLGDGPEPVIWHNGSNTMWYALLVLLPDRNAAITLVTNDGSQLSLTQRRFDAFAMEIAEAISARG